MDGGIGPTLTLVLAGVLWLVYLAPSMRRKREFESTEKNTIRIQQALRAVAQTAHAPNDVVTEISNREALVRQRERERIEKYRDAELRLSVRWEAGSAPVRANRPLKLFVTVVAVISFVVAVAFGIAAVWVGTVAAILVSGCAIVALVVINRSATTPAERVTRRRSNVQDLDPSWTPVRPPVVRQAPLPETAGLIVTADTEREVAARELATRIREQAAAALSSPEIAPDSRFTELGYETGSTAPIDINAALRARRAQ